MTTPFNEIPDARIIEGPEDLERYRRDESHFQGILPSACVRPRSAKALKALVTLAEQEGFSLIPRGAGTGKAGGCVPHQAASILVDFSDWPGAIELHPGTMTLSAPCSASLADIKSTADQAGLFYPPDPNSWTMCSFGGSLATNAGGPNACKYGMTRDYIVSVDALMSDGHVHRLGIEARKDNAGFNLAQLLIGSEGTLGFIVHATTRLIPKPTKILTLLVGCEDVSSLLTLPVLFTLKGLQPSAIEYFDATVLSELRLNGPTVAQRLKGNVFAIIEFDHDGCSDGSFMETLSETLIPALEFHLAADARQREELWNLRRLTSVLLKERYPHKISEDITVPKHRLPEFFDRLHTLPDPCVSYGHLGDGNLHVNFLNSQGRSIESFSASILALFQLTKELGGSLSGEHGIGLAKRDAFLTLTDPYVIESMRRIKKALDPKGIFNPGKII